VAIQGADKRRKAGLVEKQLSILEAGMRSNPHSIQLCLAKLAIADKQLARDEVSSYASAFVFILFYGVTSSVCRCNACGRTHWTHVRPNRIYGWRSSGSPCHTIPPSLYV